MSRGVKERRRREIRKRQKARKKTNDALEAERKLLESPAPSPAPGAAFWGVSVVLKNGNAVTDWLDQSGDDKALSRSK